MPALPLTGGCHCGAIRYEVTEAPLTVLNCHCGNCQKITTSAFAMSVIVPFGAVHITQGKPGRIEWTADSGRSRYGLFCKDCGSRILHGSDPEGPTTVLRCGTLDDKSWIEPVADIWTSTAQPWVRFTGERLEYPVQPEDMSDLFRVFADQARF